MQRAFIIMVSIFYLAACSTMPTNSAGQQGQAAWPSAIPYTSAADFRTADEGRLEGMYLAVCAADNPSSVCECVKEQRRALFSTEELRLIVVSLAAMVGKTDARVDDFRRSAGPNMGGRAASLARTCGMP